MPHPAPKRRVLVIEGDAAVRSALQRYSSLYGYDTILMASAEEGFQWLKSDTPDLILLATTILTEADGLVTLRQLHEKYEKVQVIMLAATADIPKAHAALNYGAADFIAKPINLTTLKRTLQVHLPPIK